MESSSFLEHIKLIYNYAVLKDPELKSLADKVHIQFSKNTLKLLMAISTFIYIFTGKGLQNIIVVLVVNSFLLLFMNAKTIIIMKALSIFACLGISWARFYMVGAETALYNQFHTSLASVTVLLFTDSYKVTTLCFVYIFYFTKANGAYMLNEYSLSPENFEKTLQYLMNNYNQFVVLIWVAISLIVYQKQSLLAQLWVREKEKEELLRQVQRKNQELEKFNQQKTKFLLSLSHEFRNPINAALGNLELANQRIPDPSIQKYIINCKVSIEMLFHLVSNLLDSTKIEAGILELNPLRKESRPIFYKVWGIVKNLLDKQDLIGEFYIHKNIPRILKIDSHFVVKILLNLIMNAIKYTSKGAVMTVVTWIDAEKLSDPMLQPTKDFHSKFLATFAGKYRALSRTKTAYIQSNRPVQAPQNTQEDIDIPTERSYDSDDSGNSSRLISHPSMELIDTFQRVTKDYEKLANKQNSTELIVHGHAISEERRPNSKGFLKVEVFDSGQGMDDEIKSGIFQKFSSISLGTTEDRLGLGLGLWLTKNLCESIGGQVKAFSEKDKGSQFIAIIPAEPSDHIGSPQIAMNNSPFRERRVRPNLSALVVDDDRYNREIHTIFLSQAKVTVKGEATNGQEAVEVYMSKPENYFDLILMDLEMPIMNGKEAIRRIRQFEQLHRRKPVKIIIATGNCDLKEYSECMERNGDIRADYFYRKPLIKKDFEEFIELLQT